MRKDPIVEEIHEFRETHARKFNYDVDAIFADLRRKQSRRKNVAGLKPVKPSLSRVAEAHATYGADAPKRASKNVR
jgi:hypothetical protein